MRLRQLLGFGGAYRKELAILVTLTTASSLLMLAIPWLAGHMLGGIVAGNGQAQGRIVGLLVSCLAAVALLNFITVNQMTKTGARVLADLRERIYDHVQRLPMSYHDCRSKGDTLALMTFEIQRLSLFVTATLVAIPSRLLTTIGAIILMFRIDGRLALFVPVVVPVFYLVLRFVGRHLHQLGIKLQQAQARGVSLAEEALEMLPATKAFLRERPQFERYRSAVRDVELNTVREGRIYAALEPAIGLIAALAAVALLWSGARGVEAGRMTASELFSFMFYAALLTRPVSALAQVYGQVQSARGTLTRLQSVLDEPAENVPSDWNVRRGRGEIAFRNVHFRYPGRERVLAGANLHIRGGETVALVGPNGAGKTALINLLMRYYEPQSGEILIDGENIRDLSLPDVRGRIGLVPQSAFLFNGTIGENIRFGMAHPTDKDVERAARLAQALDFINSLPEGMETLIGDRGVRLSGGQRQRIALARALLDDPPILILDEATSMFDEQGERAFIEACAEALRGRTVILVTHRPATLALAHRIVELEDGRIREIPEGPSRHGRATA